MQLLSEIRRVSYIERSKAILCTLDAYRTNWGIHVQAITIIQPHLRYGGAERQTVLLANELVSRGITCHVVLHEAKGGLVSELAEEVIVHDLGLYSQIRTLETARRLAKVLNTIEPSFVIVKLWSSILACAWAEKRTPQHVYNYCEDLDPSDHAAFIRFGKLKQALIGSIFRRKKLLSANTNTVADSMRLQYNLTKPIAVISSVVEPELVRKKASEANVPNVFSRDKLNIVTVGSLIERKGLRDTLEGLRQTGEAIRWHVVGEGPLREFLETQSCENVEIILHGGMPNPYGIMQACDLMVHGAVSEAFGIVLLEAMAVGTPVIAADSIGPTEMRAVLGANPHILELYRKSDPQDLAETINTQIARRESWPIDASDYIRPYVLDSTVKAWVARAAEYGPVR
ncbi:glycosyltransferase [Pseudarthrobacter sp. lyk4-40-TYG-27]|uniref:glycosyltransferase n=1 Tax=Pseudarthrobacter sp. lyk4-40-TYG-27 TaxID=3040305 RepID=UPI0025577D9B|nr:glycosyltransferase [Pseudarthrobacter sp. lyk4-40-TYG-27]